MATMSNQIDATVTKILADIPPLNQENFEEWLWDVQNALITGSVWTILFQPDAMGARPTCPQAGGLLPSAAEKAAQEEYDAALPKTALWIMKAAGRIHHEITEPKLLPNPDPVGMWDALARFTKKDAGG
jgi:hypothetical protein